MEALGPRRSSVSLATSILIFVFGSYLALSLFSHTQAAGFVGESDSANSLVVAKNLLEGRGFSVDYVATYLTAWPSPHHAEDSFPLLYPGLIAGVGFFTGDVVSASHVLGALFLFLYLAGLPLLAQRFWGGPGALLLAAALVAQEASQSYFERALNDAPAMVVFGASALFLLRALTVHETRVRDRAFWWAAGLSAFATQLKFSIAFFVMALAVAFFCLATELPRRQRLRRVGSLVLLVALAHVPVLLWHLTTFGALGLPQNALGRNFAREAGLADDFWTSFERMRVWLPSHPEFLQTTAQRVERSGILATLVLEPLARVGVALRRGFLDQEVLPYPVLVLLAVGAWLARAKASVSDACARKAAIFALTCVAFALLIPAYSHYEGRYLLPLRPALGLAVALAMHELTCLASPSLRRRMELAGPVGFVAALLWGALHAYWLAVGSLPALACLLVLLAAGVGFVRLGPRGAQGAARTTALAVLCGLFGLGAANGIRNLQEPLTPDANRELGAWLADVTPVDVPLMGRRVWPLSFWSRRAFVMIPYHAEDVCAAAQRYGARSMVMEDADLARQPDLARFLGPGLLGPQGSTLRLVELHCDRP